MPKLLEVGGKRLPFLRWSFIRMLVGIKHLTTEWQVGDGREAALREHVLKTARVGDPADVIRAIDEFGYGESFLMNVGDEKGEILDRAIANAAPKLLLELGAYCGYSAVRTGAAMPAGAHLVSVEWHPDNAKIARDVVEHAGLGDRVTIVHGSLDDDGTTMDALERDHGFGPGALDFAFIDHAKELYLPDLLRILERGWLHPGSVVVGDNIKFPGVPDYRDYMREHEGNEWRTKEHSTHVEYQTVIKDLLFESEYLGEAKGEAMKRMLGG